MAEGGRVHDITVTEAAGGSRVRLHDEGVPDAEAVAAAAGWTGFLGRLRVIAEGHQAAGAGAGLSVS